MNVRKFIAATARDALRKVKETLGPDAIILSNRGIPGGVEIMAVAARDMEMIVPTPERDAPRSKEYTAAAPPAPMPGRVTARDQPLLRGMSPALGQASARPNSRPPPTPAVRPLPQMELEVPQSLPHSGAKPEAEVVPVAVMEEIRTLRRLVEQQLAGFAWGEAARAEPVKTEILRQMLDVGFSPQAARDLLADLPSELEAGQALSWVKGAAERSLLTINSESDIVDQGGIYALVGPTGVGKTTTTAKLAARCVLRHGARKLALVTTDGYRIGAHEQLRIYGRILGVPVHLARDAKDLRITLHDLQHTHMVLIDTIGMSQRDRMVSEQVAMFGASNVKSLLLLSATSRGDTLDDVVRSYSRLDLAGTILTKVDEAASLASSLDVIIRHGLRLYYVSNGQRVPEDLHLPNRQYLLHRAFKDLPESSPHHLSGLEPGLMMASSAVGLQSAGGQHG
ncbi:MAG TPA: flagellar biosynthesis protein FlhF [Accumulibacter sp.]|uniref:Flagellar biosynthesis protein FlhF n=2 Tax=Candidatus Accumulibacter TaxID=327159 RepID=A0A080MBM3_9PROT|nr:MULTISPECIES: flagellar biosynthesis protein FlhF [Candidatus Accumulibacter]KFB78598.1 MAG: Flagella-associated GTP-binding protein [Candidatus Accumulibacter cognatus]MBL8402616.1 flagellar biosynthesis protein FlhF [Accumulibacter sp.]MBN8518123.1 flagellar biosynthesis protein FlhF [Accumulibacter sp.]MBO3709714.1 flagellar biosynthesis protein FlhF [Accumulibacter sp.]MCC2866808.1 flagellar biosynthesis protein FlhF [Candidatus Accumulibacter phosphatis]